MRRAPDPISGAGSPAFNALRECVVELQRLSVAAPLVMHESGAGRVIGLGGEIGGGTALFLARITDSQPVNASTDKYRWQYSWVEVEKTVAGYGADAWTPVQGGRSGAKDDPETCARNMIEWMNPHGSPFPTTGKMGNGVSIEHLLGTFVPQPAPAGVVILMAPVPCLGAVEHWFQYENTVDGACP